MRIVATETTRQSGCKRGTLSDCRREGEAICCYDCCCCWEQGESHLTVHLKPTFSVLLLLSPPLGVFETRQTSIPRGIFIYLGRVTHSDSESDVLLLANCSGFLVALRFETARLTESTRESGRVRGEWLELGSAQLKAAKWSDHRRRPRSARQLQQPVVTVKTQ